MRFLILLIIAMALWTVPTIGQTSTAPSINAPERASERLSRFQLFDSRELAKPADFGPYFCINAYPACTSRLDVFSFRQTPPLAEEIQVIDLEGLKKLLARDAKDTRPMLVNFWATWCDPCREEFPDLVKIDEDFGAKNLHFVTVSLDDVTEVKTEVPKFLKEMKATMPTLLLNVNDPEPAIKAVDTAWDGQLPATFLYDKAGKVIFRHFGRIKADELRAAIEKAVTSNK